MHVIAVIYFVKKPMIYKKAAFKKKYYINYKIGTDQTVIIKHVEQCKSLCKVV